MKIHASIYRLSSCIFWNVMYFRISTYMYVTMREREHEFERARKGIFGRVWRGNVRGK